MSAVRFPASLQDAGCWRTFSPARCAGLISDVALRLWARRTPTQAALHMALLSLLKGKVAKFDLARQEIVV